MSRAARPTSSQPGPSQPGPSQSRAVPRGGLRRARSAVLVLAATATGLVGCSSALPVEVAPNAADPVCAEIVLALPQELEDMPRLATGSQATAAWGTAQAPVVLRCGVEPPGPSTDQCVTAEDGSTSVDWLAVPDESSSTDPAADQEVAWTFTTYGRDPAVEVRVPAAVISTRSSGFLLSLGPAVDKAERTRGCL